VRAERSPPNGQLGRWHAPGVKSASVVTVWDSIRPIRIARSRYPEARSPGRAVGSAVIRLLGGPGQSNRGLRGSFLPADRQGAIVPSGSRANGRLTALGIFLRESEASAPPVAFGRLSGTHIDD
jgi:hypothetical protein